jgi:predicted transcriptional regulator
MTKLNQTISTITGILVALLAAAAFWLSFDALRHLAAQNGIEVSMAWLYPAIIDGAIIIFSLSVLQTSLNKEKAAYPWGLVALFTILSIILNITHAQPTFLPRVLAAIPPMALFLSFELLMNQVKGIVQRTAVWQSLAELGEMMRQKRVELDELIRQKTAELEELVKGKTAEVEKLSEQIVRLENKKNELAAEIATLQREQKGYGSRLEHLNAERRTAKQAALEALLAFVTQHPNASLSEIASAIARSKSTASSYVSELQENGRLHKNGHGWEVQS